MSTTYSNITLLVLVELIRAWKILYTREEIWLDLPKLRLLEALSLELVVDMTIPEEVVEYYTYIFSRNMWGQHESNNNRTSNPKRSE